MVTKPVHLTLIVLATVLLLLYLLLDWPPRTNIGDTAFHALIWTKHAARLIKVLACYLGFSVVVVGHAVCSQKLHPLDAAQSLDRDE